MPIDFLSTTLLGDIGWIMVVIYIFIELRWGRGKVIDELNERLDMFGIIMRAVARTTEEIDTDAVDGMLRQNGYEPSDFIVEDEEGDPRLATDVERDAARLTREKFEDDERKRLD